MARGNGEGTIYKRNDRDGWSGQVSVGVDPETGKVKRKTVYGKTRRAVQKKITSIKQKYNVGDYIEPGTTRLIDWMYKWLNVYKKPSIRPRTYKSYESTIRVHISEIGHYPLDKIRPIYIQEFINRKASCLSKRGIRYIRTILKAALNQAVIDGMILKNPASHISIPKSKIPKKVPRAFTIEEQAKFEEKLKGSYYANALTLALETGMRRGEVLGLKWDDINYDNNVIHVKRGIVEVKQEGKTEILEQPPKTEAGKREIPMTTYAKRALKQQYKQQLEQRLKLGKNYNNNNIVFANAYGSYICPRNLSRAHYKVLKKAGIDKCGMHTLRHTFATRLIEQNANVKMIQALLGHADISTTLNTYSHALPNEKAKTIKLIDRQG